MCYLSCKISVEIKGYKIFRLDRTGKSCAGVCAYIKHSLKGRILKDWTGESGLHQLWLYTNPEQENAVDFVVYYC